MRPATDLNCRTGRNKNERMACRQNPKPLKRGQNPKPLKV